MKIKLHKVSVKHSPSRTGAPVLRVYSGWSKGRAADEGFFVPRHLVWAITDYLKDDDEQDLLSKLAEVEK